MKIIKADGNQNGRRATKLKMRYNYNMDLLLKLKMITGSRSIRGILFIEAVLKKT